MISRYERSLPTPERDKLLTVDKSSLNALSRSEVSGSFINLFLIPDSAFFFQHKAKRRFFYGCVDIFCVNYSVRGPSIKKAHTGSPMLKTVNRQSLQWAGMIIM